MLKSLLFGGKLKVLAAVLGVLAVSVGGAFTVGVVGVPSVDDVENRFGNVTDSTTTIHTDLHVSNPNPIGVNLGGTTAEYTVEMNGIEMAHGKKESIALERGNSTLDFTTRMDNAKIPAWWASHIQNGEHTDLTVHADVYSSIINRSFGAPEVNEPVDTDIIGEFNSTERRPVNANTPVVSDPVAYIERTNASWGAVSEERTPIDMRFDVYNPKAVPITITEIGYTITMNDIRVGEGASEETYVVPPGGTETLWTTTAIDNTKLDAWWATHLRNNQITEMEIDFYAKVDLSEVGGGEARVPLAELTHTETIETDLFGTKNQTDAQNNGADTETNDGATETTTEPDNEDTEASSGADETEADDDDGLLDIPL